MRTLKRAGLIGGLLLLGVGCVLAAPFGTGDIPPGFADQACALPPRWLEFTQRGHYGPRSGDIAILPRTPAYMSNRGGGWTHSGPWPYVQDVPLVFYGPGIVPATGAVGGASSLADLAPTLAEIVGVELPDAEGQSLEAVARAAAGRTPRLIVTVVWDGGGWNVLRKWAGSWPNLGRMIEEGVSYAGAVTGSSPSVTPAVHTTIGTGAYPWVHGVPLIRVKDERGEIVDSFYEGESSRFIRVPTLAETWDEHNDGAALVGMVGYEAWHLGMIGKGAEASGGDRDHAVWLDESNRWITEDEHYELPANFQAQDRLRAYLRVLDLADGRADGAWGEHRYLDDRALVDRTPAFVHYHAGELIRLIDEQGYGRDDITDLLFTNFKQPDRVGHSFNMASTEVRDSIAAVDEALGDLVEALDERFEPGEYVVVVTADHGQQPDEEAIGGFGIDPTKLAADIDSEFGPVTHSVAATEIFLDRTELTARGHTVGDVARFVAGYRLRDNVPSRRVATTTGRFGPDDLLFDLAMPSELLDDLSCEGRRES